MTKLQMLIAGGLYTTAAALTPVLAILATGTEITPRIDVTAIIAAIIAGAIACKAYTSTSFSDHEIAEGRTIKPSIKRK